METGDGEPSGSSADLSGLNAELSAVEAEIGRLSLRRDELRTLIASSGVARPIAQPSARPTDRQTSLPKADWYPDPSGRYAWRYWNGREWTDSVARNGVTYTDLPTSGPSTSRTTPRPTASEQSASTAPSPSRPMPMAGPETGPPRQPTDIDVGKLILIVGAALLIGGIGGLTAYLWSKLPAIGQLVLLGIVSAAQIIIATRIRERLRVAAEAFAATGVATLLFTVLSVSRAATWDGAIGVSLGVVGIFLLLVARFRAWVIAGHLAIVIGAVGVLVAEPWPQTALIIAVILGAVRWAGLGTRTSFRSPDVQLFPEILTASGLAALLAVPALAAAQYETTSAVIVYVLVALAVSEIIVRTQTFKVEHKYSLVAGVAIAIGGVGSSAILWPSGVRSDGVAGMVMTAVVALLFWRASRTEVALRPQLTALAVGLAPVAARFACDPASGRELVVFSAIAAVAGLAASRVFSKSLTVWFWIGAVAASAAATEQLAAWPRLGLITVALASLALLLELDGLRYAAAATATLTIADVLYGTSVEVPWWFRPDIVGASAAAFLFVAVRTQSTPREIPVGSWHVPRYWESMVALLAVPVADLVSRPALADLPDESLWRLGLVVVLAVAAWGYGVVRRTRLSAAQIVSAVAVAALVVSRVADESAAVRTGAWLVIGCLATVALASIAHIKKTDELRYAAAASATATVAVLLYGQLIHVAWWFRPDVIGAASAVFLYLAVRTQSSPWSTKLGSWSVPRYWESAVGLLVVPTVDVASQPALAHLPAASKWRLGFILVVAVLAWTNAAVRRTKPNAAQVTTLVAIGILIVSRIDDDSTAMQTGAWVLIGCVFIVAALRVKRVELLVPAAASWMIAVGLYSPPGPLEVLTCSLAAIAGVVAVIARRFGRTGTFDFIPAAALALVPSAIAAAGAVLDASVDSEQVTRITIVLMVGAVALAIGTYRRLAALVGPAIIALVVLAAAQLIVVQRHTSGWVSALVAGVVLLVVGTRLEYLRSISRRASDLVRSLR